MHIYVYICICLCTYTHTYAYVKYIYICKGLRNHLRHGIQHNLIRFSFFHETRLAYYHEITSWHKPWSICQTWILFGIGSRTSPSTIILGGTSNREGCHRQVLESSQLRFWEQLPLFSFWRFPFCFNFCTGPEYCNGSTYNVDSQKRCVEKGGLTD